MGLCMRVSRTGDEWDIGYRGYFLLRYLILREIDENVANVWKNWCLNNGRFFTMEEFKKIYDLKLVDFIAHSDCDGILGRRKVKRTLLGLEKIDFKSEEWKEDFDGLKNIFRIAVENKSSIKYC